tara:strand:+ start:1738 stop:2058 length:321 start_codon:yes stop_codon:yes gene_type:complete
MSEEEEELAEIKKISDMRIVDDAYSDSYNLLTDLISFDELIKNKEDSLDEGDEIVLTVLMYDPDEGPMQDELEGMIRYYVGLEEYERCAILRGIMNDAYPETIVKE